MRARRLPLIGWWIAGFFEGDAAVASATRRPSPIGILATLLRSVQEPDVTFECGPCASWTNVDAPEAYPPRVPTDTFRHSATTPVEVEAVWAQLQEPDKWRAMGGIDEIHDPRIEAELLKGFAFTSRIAGTPYRGKATTTEAVHREKMVVNVDTSELKAVLTVELTPIDASTRLDVTMQLSSKSFLASMMWGVVASTVGSGLPHRTAEMIAAFE